MLRVNNTLGNSVFNVLVGGQVLKSITYFGDAELGPRLMHLWSRSLRAESTGTKAVIEAITHLFVGIDLDLSFIVFS